MTETEISSIGISDVKETICINTCLEQITGIRSHPIVIRDVAALIVFHSPENRVRVSVRVVLDGVGGGNDVGRAWDGVEADGGAEIAIFADIRVGGIVQLFRAVGHARSGTGENWAPIFSGVGGDAIAGVGKERQVP